MEKPYNGFIRIFKYLQFALRSGNAHSIHSPFVFDLYNELKSVNDLEPISAIRVLHDRLKTSNEEITFDDPGRENLPTTRSIGSIARQSATNPKSGKILFNLVKHVKPEHVLELGTSLGISGLYLSCALRAGKLVTVEGVPQIASLAEQHFKDFNANATVISSTFESALRQFQTDHNRFDLVYLDGHHQKDATLSYFSQIKQILAPNAICVLDDIYWSKGMEEAWSILKKDKDVDISIDLFHYGILIFRKDTVKQHFSLRI